MIIEKKTGNEVQAFQRVELVATVPDWAILDNRIDVRQDNSICIKSINAGFPKIGQWVVKDVKNDLSIISEEQFEKIYEVIPEWELQKINKNKDPHGMGDEELLYNHSILHYRYVETLTGRKYEGWSKEDFVNYHVLMVDVMKEKQVPHFPYGDQLDKDSKQFEKVEEKSIAGDRIFLEELFPVSGSLEFYHNYISIVGGIAEQGSTEGAIDILIYEHPDARTEFHNAMEWQILRQHPPELWNRFQFHYDKSYTPFIKSTSLFDMRVVRVEEEAEFPQEKIEISKAEDPFMVMPSEENTYDYVVQNHFRGKSFHSDLRMESANKDSLVGWTLFTAMAGTIREPITAMIEAETIAKRGITHSKIDFNTGEWAQRKRPEMAGSINVEIGASRKSMQPVAWLKSNIFWEHVQSSLLKSGLELNDKSLMEKLPADLKEKLLMEFIQKIHGVVPAGEIGATANYPGVFYIMDKGKVEYLAQKPWMHEYYFKSRKGRGGLRGRYLFRQLRTEDIGKGFLLKDFPGCSEKAPIKLEDLKAASERYKIPVGNIQEILYNHVEELESKKIVVPAAEQEFKDEAAWFFIKAEDQTPYVLSNRAVDQKWIPPRNISALPEYIRKQIPAKFQYWKLEKDRDRIEIRDQLIKSMKDKDVNITIEKNIESLSQENAKFVLQCQTWHSKDKIDDANKKYCLRIDTGKNMVMSWLTQFDLLETKDAVGHYEKVEKATMQLEGNVASGTQGENLSNIKIVDSGDAIVLSDEPTFKRVEFKGGKLNGLWTINKHNDVWLIKRNLGA